MTREAARREWPLAIVLGLSATGLYAVRELGRAGVPVVGIGSPLEPGLASRFLKRRIRAGSKEEALEILRTAFEDEDHAPVLIPTSDDYIDLVGAHATELSRSFRFQSSYLTDTWRCLLDKFEFYAACERAGIRYPKLVSAQPGSLAETGEKLEFPLLIKPSEIHKAKGMMSGRKVWIARTARDLQRLNETIPAAAGTLLLQEIIPGSESNIMLWAGYIAADGDVHQPFTARKLRQYPPGFGSASLVQSVTDEEVADASMALLQGIGFRGIAAVEWKRDPRDGCLVAIEVNARPSLWFSLSTAAGKTITLAAYHDLAGHPERVPERPQRDRLRWRYLLKDAWSAGFYRRARDFVLPPPDLACVETPTGRSSVVFASDDPMPALAEMRMFAAKGMRRLLSR